MVKKDWRVNILKKYRRSLSKRFNPRNAKKELRLSGSSIVIEESCSLCKDYTNPYGCVKKCPFYKFAITQLIRGRRVNIKSGCYVWLDHVVSSFTDWTNVLPFNISWCVSDNPRVVKMFKQLRKEAKKLIIWV